MGAQGLELAWGWGREMGVWLDPTGMRVCWQAALVLVLVAARAGSTETFFVEDYMVAL